MSSDTDSIDFFDASEGGSHGSSESVLVSSRYLKPCVKVESVHAADTVDSEALSPVRVSTDVGPQIFDDTTASLSNNARRIRELMPPLATISEDEHHQYNAESILPADPPASKVDTDSDNENSSVSTAASSLMKRLSHAFSSLHSIAVDNQDINDPSVLRVVPVRKSLSDFKKMKIFQELPQFHRGPVWKMKFSCDGKYFATAGQDNKLIIWTVGITSSIDDVSADVMDEGEEAKPKMAQQSTFISPTPHRIFNDHSNDIVDIDWSRMNFLLSASLDKTVRLWHISRYSLHVCVYHAS